MRFDRRNAYRLRVQAQRLQKGELLRGKNIKSQNIKIGIGKRPRGNVVYKPVYSRNGIGKVGFYIPVVLAHYYGYIEKFVFNSAVHTFRSSFYIVGSYSGGTQGRHGGEKFFREVISSYLFEITQLFGVFFQNLFEKNYRTFLRKALIYPFAHVFYGKTRKRSHVHPRKTAVKDPFYNIAFHSEGEPVGY